MQDQVTSFTKRGMTAVQVGSDCSPSLVDDIISGELQLVYMSPETILTVPTWREMFRNRYYRDNLICLAVDEAHLVEKWWVSVHVCLVCVCMHGCYTEIAECTCNSYTPVDILLQCVCVYSCVLTFSFCVRLLVVAQQLKFL